jgi:hypothetical protein
MKRTFVWMTVGGLLALGCTDAVAPSSDGGLTLSLAVSAAAVPRGTPDTLVLTLTNTSYRLVSLTAGGCPLLFYVTDAGGETVVPSGGHWVCVAIITRIVLAPGAHETRRFIWATDAHEPGSYRVFGTFAAGDVRLATPGESVRIE